MTSAAAWSDIPVGTRVLVRRADGTHFEARTASRPFDMLGGAAVVRVSDERGFQDYYALDRVHLAGPPERSAVTIADAIQSTAPEAQLAFIDKPTTVIVTAILFYLTVGACVVAQVALSGSP